MSVKNAMEIPTVKERSTEDLLELVQQLHSRTGMYPNNKGMHDAWVEARAEMLLRIKELAALNAENKRLSDMMADVNKAYSENSKLKLDNKRLKEDIIKLQSSNDAIWNDRNRIGIENERLKNLLKEIEDICTDYDTPGIEALKIMELIKHEAK